SGASTAQYGQSCPILLIIDLAAGEPFGQNLLGNGGGDRRCRRRAWRPRPGRQRLVRSTLRPDYEDDNGGDADEQEHHDQDHEERPSAVVALDPVVPSHAGSPSVAGTPAWTTSTGQLACSAQAALTEPSSRPVK